MHVAAEGPLKTLILLLVACAVVIAAVTYSEPLTTEYEVKTAAKIACNAYHADVRANEPNRRSWEAPFVQRARQVGVQLKPQQYDFEVSSTAVDRICKIQVAWRSTTPIFLVGDVLDIPPLVIVHRLDFDHTIPRNY